MKSTDSVIGVTYRCKECGVKLGDPDLFRSFENWSMAVREHVQSRHHPEVGWGTLKLVPLNDWVTPFFIWTTPTGQEVVTTR